MTSQEVQGVLEEWHRCRVCQCPISQGEELELVSINKPATKHAIFVCSNEHARVYWHNQSAAIASVSFEQWYD